jgi:hypothetical protein
MVVVKTLLSIKELGAWMLANCFREQPTILTCNTQMVIKYGKLERNIHVANPRYN